MNNSKELTIKLIKSLLDCYHQSTSKQDYAIDKKNIKYILNQTLRQMWIPANKLYVSVKADELWSQITSSDHFIHFYKDAVVLKNVDAIELDMYKGNAKLPYARNTFYKNDKFSFREVFHDDHIIPLKHFVKKLIELENITDENIANIIGGISICRMLKSEDRAIPNKSARALDERKVITELYKEKAGIVIKNYSYL